MGRVLRLQVEVARSSQFYETTLETYVDISRYVEHREWEREGEGKVF